MKALAHGESVVLLTVTRWEISLLQQLLWATATCFAPTASRLGSLGDQSLDAAANMKRQYQAGRAGRSRTGTLALWSENF